MQQVLSVPQPAQAVPDGAKRTVSVHTGRFQKELEVNSAETGWQVAERIAAGICHHAGLLTSGGCVIDQRQQLLHQVQHETISYLVPKLGAGLAAMLWERVLEDKIPPDVAVLNETKSPTIPDLNQGLRPSRV